MSFLGGVNTPPPNGQSNTPDPTRTIPLKAPAREMKMPSSTGMGIGDILNKINKEEKKVGSVPPPAPPPSAPQPTFSAGPPPPVPARKSVLRKSGGSERKSAKNSVVIKL
jgi:hypothetical protein